MAKKSEDLIHVSPTILSSGGVQHCQKPRKPADDQCYAVSSLKPCLPCQESLSVLETSSADLVHGCSHDVQQTREQLPIAQDFRMQRSHESQRRRSSAASHPACGKQACETRKWAQGRFTKFRKLCIGVAVVMRLLGSRLPTRHAKRTRETNSSIWTSCVSERGSNTDVFRPRMSSTPPAAETCQMKLVHTIFHTIPRNTHTHHHGVPTQKTRTKAHVHANLPHFRIRQHMSFLTSSHPSFPFLPSPAPSLSCLCPSSSLPLSSMFVCLPLDAACVTVQNRWVQVVTDAS